MDFEHPSPDPLVEFHRWFEQAQQTSLPNPNAMTLATADAAGRPSARIVLLKHIDEHGAVFYTNRNGRKGRDLAANPRAALLFHWDVLDRQVRIEGDVTLVSDAESDAYFATRPRDSRIGAWASRQSEPVASRSELDAAVEAVRAKYEGVDVPRPPHWGGYRVSLDSMEFWEGSRYRLHDRVLYTRESGRWKVTRLFP